jgi:endonuclease/exonuclease/phosphatase (EEP) superfamily protein YafD
MMSALSRLRHSLFPKIFSSIGWLTVASTLIWVTLFTLTGEKITLVRWVSYVLPWLSGLLLIQSIPSFILKKKKLAIALLSLGILFFLPYIHLFIPSETEAPPGQPVYKVMTYSKMGRNRDIEAVASVVLSEKPDILFMQEINQEDSENLVALVSNMYNGKPVHYYADPFKGLILSRFTVTPKIKKGDYSLAAEIDLDGTRTFVWNVHLQKSITDTQLQDKMIQQLVEQIETTAGPIIVWLDSSLSVNILMDLKIFITWRYVWLTKDIMNL